MAHPSGVKREHPGWLTRELNASGDMHTSARPNSEQPAPPVAPPAAPPVSKQAEND
jgi:hypothetical protein